eukprot:jgi/Tetstr1/448159/TSEL_035451.t1
MGVSTTAFNARTAQTATIIRITAILVTPAKFALRSAHRVLRVAGTVKTTTRASDQRYVIFEELRDILAILKSTASFPKEQHDDLQFEIERCQSRLVTCIAHLVRGKVEADSKAVLRSRLQPHI